MPTEFSRRRFRRALGALLVLLAAAPAAADVIVIEAAKDSSIYSETSPAANTASGQGLVLPVGRNNGAGASDGVRRSLLFFDVLNQITVGSTINSVTLTLNMQTATMGGPTNVNVEVHRLLGDWGEGPSLGAGGNGDANSPFIGDATWDYQFYNTDVWTTPGGDFVVAPSATAVVSKTVGPVSWSSVTLNADVQAWVNNPSSNFGWILTGNELVNQTIRQFSSSEALTASLRPTLTIDYTPAAVPEPSSLVLTAIGAAFGTRIARRRKGGSSPQVPT